MEINVDIPDVPHGETVELEVWDGDMWSANDHRGTANMIANGSGGPYLVDMKPSLAEEQLGTLSNGKFPGKTD